MRHMLSKTKLARPFHRRWSTNLTKSRRSLLKARVKLWIHHFAIQFSFISLRKKLSCKCNLPNFKFQPNLTLLRRIWSHFGCTLDGISRRSCCERKDLIVKWRQENVYQGSSGRFVWFSRKMCPCFTQICSFCFKVFRLSLITTPLLLLH